MNNNRVAQSFRFMFLLTFVGGYLNAYSFFARGGNFVSMQSGNMVKFGISIYTKDFTLFVSAIMPMMGCLIGAVISHLIQYKFKNNSTYKNNQNTLWIELIALMIIALIPPQVSNILVCFLISIIAGYQLNSFKNYEDLAHFTTLASGSIRNLAQRISEFIITKDMNTFIRLVKYTFLLFSFGFGAFVGAIFSNLLGTTSLLFAPIILSVMSLMLKLEQDKKAIAFAKIKVAS